ncbi:Uncharacterized protein dnm_003480 [Desulfonema magnum]|uniref:Uncharacterized protein n=1 Tax=Desulfonema magnum TaxID=45655 RepID=A0A975BFQ3_9BACT|nr:Uncharacterized protein dnm_003480 [Desulfonema magnum]
MCERRDTSVFFATKARRHEVSRSLVFVAGFFGCVKSGTGHFFCHEGTKTQIFTKSLCGFVANFFRCVKGGTLPSCCFDDGEQSFLGRVSIRYFTE